MTNIAIYASGNGTNAQRIIQHFDGHLTIQVRLILTNNPNAGVIQRAEALGVSVEILEEQDIQNGQAHLNYLNACNIHFIALAGYLKPIPSGVVQAYAQRIINIHPSLLPRFGGKGMYGMKVHHAVHEAKAPQSGITIHHVTEEYDIGPIVFQVALPVLINWTVNDLASAVHQLEYHYYPFVIEEFLQ
jgi:phosphoribosylglycinamide formyltransferase 1